MSEPDLTASGGPAPQLRRVPSDATTSPHWQGLLNAGNEATFVSAWLALQCSRIAGVSAGLLLMRGVDSTAPSLSVTWPPRDVDASDLMRLAETAYKERRLVVAPGRVGPDSRPAQPVALIVAQPLGTTNEPIAAVAIALTTTAAKPLVTPAIVAEQLRWGAGWLEALPWARHTKDLSSDVTRAASCLDLLVTVNAQPRLSGMAIAVVNELATRLRCERVSLGVVGRNGTICLRAVSFSSSFKRESRLVNSIESAMEEAIEQRECIAYPPLPSMRRVAAIAHRALAEEAKASGSSTMSAVLIGPHGKPIGALTLERHRAEPFSDDELKLVEGIAALLGPQIGLQLRANRLLGGRVVDSIGDGCAALFGARRPALKLCVAGAIALALILAFAKGEHRVTAKSVLEAEVQRAAVAPFDGFVRAAPARAGDTVRQGDLLTLLDDRDLVLDRLKRRAELDKLLQRDREALAKHNRNGLAVLEPQIRQAEAQLALAEENLARTRILAPFDGIVVSGDLSQMLGSPVEKGKTLFEVAPLNSYRLIVQVDERDVRFVAVGQSGTVALAGRPGEPVPMTLSKITPVTLAEEGRNAFRIEARLSEPGIALRPGMEGVAKINSGRRSIAWIWLHPVIDWLRIAAWKYLP
ncbi:HlyD family efflux transporter periplasmic adaptor subunit [Bradyrhizobium frederickii]|uniref:HlyD family efflux transporter periplasmic adaptor subunit n=1 Tax=Bradyrhizobium frederickii TaxID=2560054 RepID=A0A4Y9L7F6_9BRAD|nr:HlyD family efflux transporter periplasmic adaptor subunit [Bradyrhizobium frederickii]TFV39498.1 HlyD family efflux transporter periplasmic adaptor subunit [Bradyrhizobium frederickii]